MRVPSVKQVISALSVAVCVNSSCLVMADEDDGESMDSALKTSENMSTDDFFEAEGSDSENESISSTSPANTARPATTNYESDSSTSPAGERLAIKSQSPSSLPLVKDRDGYPIEEDFRPKKGKATTDGVFKRSPDFRRPIFDRRIEEKIAEEETKSEHRKALSRWKNKGKEEKAEKTIAEPPPELSYEDSCNTALGLFGLPSFSELKEIKDPVELVNLWIETLTIYLDSSNYFEETSYNIASNQLLNQLLDVAPETRNFLIDRSRQRPLRLDDLSYLKQDLLSFGDESSIGSEESDLGEPKKALPPFLKIRKDSHLRKRLLLKNDDDLGYQSDYSHSSANSAFSELGKAKKRGCLNWGKALGLIPAATLGIAIWFLAPARVSW